MSNGSDHDQEAPIRCYRCGEPLELVTGVVRLAQMKARTVEQALAYLAARYAALAPCHTCPLWNPDNDACTSLLDEDADCARRVVAWAIEIATTHRQACG